MKTGDIIKWVAGGLALVAQVLAVVLLQSLDSQVGQLRGQMFTVTERATEAAVEIKYLRDRVEALEARLAKR